MLTIHRRFTPAFTRQLSTTPPKVKNFINGVFEESKSNDWIKVINPASQEIVCLVPNSTDDELKRVSISSV